MKVGLSGTDCRGNGNWANTGPRAVVKSLHLILSKVACRGFKLNFFFPALNLYIVAHTCNCSAWKAEAEAGESQD